MDNHDSEKELIEKVLFIQVFIIYSKYYLFFKKIIYALVT